MFDDSGVVLSGLLARPCTAPLLRAVLLHDYDTHRHLLAVGTLTARVAMTAGLSHDDALQLAKAGLFHDIGKLYVDPRILQTDARLTPHDWTVLRAHAEIGESMLRDCGEHELAPIVRAHHERLDGSGYPDGLRGRSISWKTRLLSVVDAYDAMRAGRPYARAVDHDTAIERLLLAREQFDPEAVDVLAATIEEEATPLVS